MYPILSYGAPRFSLGDVSVVFSAKNPAGIVDFEPVEEWAETLSGYLINRFKGWRAVAYIKLYNIKDADLEKHLSLMNMINSSKRSGVPILLQPRYATGINLDLWVLLDGNFGYKEITNLNAGQTVELKFKAKQLMQDLPLVANRPGYLRLAEDAYLLLKDGSRLIVRQTGYEEIDPGKNVNFG
ncbi:MAG: hypothetical protein PHY48_12770 [Candidatus Cloacimonetes bacterium]|nr:hypothetical protein [Candidatus Cloacimonadota bacterium]MDD2230271.1 hypothetical protein [Candidatus Cloacimonadota bacterium]